MRPGAHVPLKRPVSTQPVVQSESRKRHVAVRRSWVYDGPVPHGRPQDRELAPAGTASCRQRTLSKPAPAISPAHDVKEKPMSTPATDQPPDGVSIVYPLGPAAAPD